MAKSIDLELLNEKLGAYCLTHREQLLGAIITENKSFDIFTPMAGVIDEEPIIDFEIGNIVKPYSSDWTPNDGALKPVPRKMKVRPIKVEVELEPLAYHSTYLGHGLKQSGANPANIPFEGYLMEKLIAKAKEQVELHGIFKGQYNELGTTAIDTMDGLLKIIAEEIQAGKLDPKDVGDATPSNTVDVFEKLFDTVPEEWQEAEFILMCPPSMKTNYNRDYRQRLGNVTHNSEFNKTKLDAGNVEIVGMPGLAGTNRIILTPKWNVFLGTDLVEDMGSVRTQLDRWKIYVMLSFKLGVQVGSLKYLFVNALPSDAIAG